MKKIKIKKFNSCPKLRKPVLIPTRKETLEIMEELKPAIVNRFLSVDEFVQDAGTFIGTRFNVDVKHAESAQVEHNDLELTGFYDGGLDEAGDTPIEIYLVTNPMQDVMIVGSENFKLICRKIANTLSHEVIHMKQFRARDFLEVEKLEWKDFEDYDEDEDEENRWYLSSPDEIDAYAYNIANELLENNALPDIMQKLNNIKEISIEDSIDLWAYIQAFEKDISHPVIRRLMKRLYKSLIHLSK